MTAEQRRKTREALQNYYIDTFNHSTTLFNKNFQYSTSLTLVFTRVNVNCITFFNM